MEEETALPGWRLHELKRGYDMFREDGLAMIMFDPSQEKPYTCGTCGGIFTEPDGTVTGFKTRGDALEEIARFFVAADAA